ncbi:centrosomal protein of 89 kDa isoform X2 [Denticeps clupeoides]|uniref:centrosomal protein of 89 kDa isoform X2 n=1 Tax=Denticeps clupeoides TaxID=299321 RepID=UPI0010A2EE37|nr:centrosomal protein of 89 kDa isoform X2 [Denticeps clupeoides]
MSKFNFSFRKSGRKQFKHIAHGLMPAATIAPRPAVPRTPPPRSPHPSPERPRSALAAAILTSSLTGRTVAIPPARQRSYSESDCAPSDPCSSTAFYTRDRWMESTTASPHLLSPSHSDEDEEEDECDENGHVYQSLERSERVPAAEPVYALPLKQSEADDQTEDTSLDVVSPLRTEDKVNIQQDILEKSFSPKQSRNEFSKMMASPAVGADINEQEQKELLRFLREKNQELNEERQALEKNNHKQALQLHRKQEHIQHLELELSRACKNTSPPAGKKTQQELQALRQQAQELVDENDGLKLTVHRLNVELSRYQTKFRAPQKENDRSGGLPLKGSSPPWLLDMKYLSPLLLAYEDRLTDKDAHLQACEEELIKFRMRTEEVIRENEKLHEQLGKSSGISHKEWRQLQDQARLVLQENKVLIEQLEVQHTKAKEARTRHQQEVSKVTKQLMLLETDNQKLQQELEAAQRELRSLQTQHHQARASLDNTVSWDHHNAATTKLKQTLEDEEKRHRTEADDLLARVASLQSEKKTLVLERVGLTASLKSLEAELDMSRQANRKAQKKTALLRKHVEESIENELSALQQMANVMTLAEKTIQERDSLIVMASAQEKDKHGVVSRIIQGTVQLGKLQEKFKVYRKQTADRLGAMGQRLEEQEQEFEGKAASYQHQIHHLQRLLQDKQEALERALQQKREVEGELEVVWEAATRENALLGIHTLHRTPQRPESS